MEQLDILTADLKAALIIAPRQDIRHYLNGVCVDVRADGARLVSSDGHRLLVVQIDAEPRKPVQIIVPYDAVKAVKGRSQGVTLAYDAENPRAPCKLGDAIFEPIDYKFPDYARILPRGQPSGKPAEFNPRYLADWQDVYERAGGAKGHFGAYVFLNGGDAAPVLFVNQPRYFGAIMPVRRDKLEYALPAWIGGGK